jgi:hypothetical protein
MPVASATATPRASPMSVETSRKTPRPQIAKPMQAASVTTPTSTSDWKSGRVSPIASSVSATPTRPSWMPTTSTAKPAMSGWNTTRRRSSRRDRPISTSPAKIVMPATAGRPPALAARIAGAK